MRGRRLPEERLTVPWHLDPTQAERPCLRVVRVAPIAAAVDEDEVQPKLRADGAVDRPGLLLKDDVVKLFGEPSCAQRGGGWVARPGGGGARGALSPRVR